ncbi:GNAT family N-acetyltransferase [Aestuariimicrobium sp. Y1814]|uniref:GNAT family N-acetyltransferase n=1 Tax=Aestuariimicrobium sp. Y1814 TaxID=3418742 RepID=UPI003DA7625D
MSHDRPLTPAQNPATVRLAMPVEALQIAEIQRRAWAKDPVQSRFLKRVDLDEMAEAWHQAITRSPLAHYRVLVATEPTGRPEPTEVHDRTKLAQRVVGFAAIGPSDDPDAGAHDAEVGEFIIDDLGKDLGHDGRLLNALVDTMRADGYQRAVWWVRSTDDERRRFLVESGWAADGAHRELGAEDEDVMLRQVRLHTDISAG